ncbi:MAG: hypothetical protein OWS03_12900 [Alicyclobacillaceae bacterium]|nr:hypothetical protein [Alicyclobacillaceae bacterium]
MDWSRTGDWNETLCFWLVTVPIPLDGRKLAIFSTSLSRAFLLESQYSHLTLVSFGQQIDIRKIRTSVSLTSPILLHGTRQIRFPAQIKRICRIIQ